MERRMPPHKRTFVFKVSKKIKGMIVDSRVFAEIKNVIIKENQEIFESAKSRVYGILERNPG